MRKYDKSMMKTAYVWAEESYCRRNKVGAVIGKDGRVISIGYNGTIKNADNNCEDEIEGTNQLVTKQNVIHAEANALTFAAKNGIKTKNCILYVTLSPCIECSKLIVQSGIKEVVYNEEYRIIDGIEFLRKHKVKVIKSDIGK